MNKVLLHPVKLVAAIRLSVTMYVNKGAWERKDEVRKRTIHRKRKALGKCNSVVK
jgi:hypothetical protein